MSGDAGERVLTKHQRKILVALDALRSGVANVRDWRSNGNDTSGFFMRRQIGRVMNAGEEVWHPPQVGSMRKLREAGLVEPESDLVLHLIDMEYCICKCDRWKITESGAKLVATWKVNIPKQERSAL